jgi:superfamily II DNA or RNA helicase
MESSFSPDCVRRISNWTSVKAHHKFDKTSFEKDRVLEDLPLFSPKYNQLIKVINEVDARDMKEHGRLFKHFIFSDVKSQGAGARMVASVVLAAGMHLIYDKKHSIKKDSVLLHTRGKNAALLIGTPVFDKPISVGTQKEVLAKFNQRPDNVYGDLCRFMIISGDYKEGIDLFDVKYAHIMEPQTSKADLRQAIGRGTRMCGQLGLEFHPSQGWPLNVFLYDVSLPDNLSYAYGADTLFNLYLKNSKIDLRKILFADQLETATIHAAADYELNKNIHRFELDKDEGYDLGWLFDGGARAISCKDKCRAEPTVQMPISTPLMIAAYMSMGRKLPDLREEESVRLWLCAVLKRDKVYCQELREVWNDSTRYVRENSQSLIAAIKREEHNKLPSKEREAFLRLCYAIIPDLKKKYSAKKAKEAQRHQPQRKEEKHEEVLVKPPSKDVAMKDAKDTKEKSSKDAVMKDAKDTKEKSSKDVAMKQATKEPFKKPLPLDILMEEAPSDMGPIEPMKDHAGFLDVRNYVRENLSQYSWPKVKLENACARKPDEPKAKKAPAAPVPTSGQLLKFTPSQDFIRHYFTPVSPVKGMLIFHSVGCGKSCTAIATATSTFEKQNYTILWVTRASLKSDIWKNVFNQVCHVILQDKIRNGLKIPKDQSDRMKLLSKSWSIRPMSYKQFSNMVEAKNSFYDDLVKKNGKEDPLKNTLLIIDEAHKLYGGADLSSQERPNMAKFQKALMNSYELSGRSSVRLLLMTGTPITNDPMEMIKLINLTRPMNKQLPTEFDDFSRVYLDSDGKFTKKGKWQYLNDIAGVVSYLNRERDARQFSQPVITPILTDMSASDFSQIEEQIEKKNQQKDDLKASQEFVKEAYQGEKKHLARRCKSVTNVKLLKECKRGIKLEEKELNDALKRELDEIKIKDNIVKTELKELKEELKKDDPSQEGTLLQKCAKKK